MGWALAPLGGQATAWGSRCQGHPALDRPEGGPPWACAIEVPQTQPSALPATVLPASLRPSPVPGSSCQAPNCANSGPCRLGAAPSPRHPTCPRRGLAGSAGEVQSHPQPWGHSELSAPPSGVLPSEVHTQRPGSEKACSPGSLHRPASLHPKRHAHACACHLRWPLAGFSSEEHNLGEVGVSAVVGSLGEPCQRERLLSSGRWRRLWSLLIVSPPGPRL